MIIDIELIQAFKGIIISIFTDEDTASELHLPSGPAPG